MAYQLVFAEPPAADKAVGDNVFLDDLPLSYKVYLFYYAGSMADEVLEKRLRELGDITGNNLFVNIGKLDDVKHDEIERRFEITKYPVIVLTATPDLASPPGSYLSAYARLDSDHLLNSPDQTIRCVQEVFNLFNQGKVAEAISRAEWRQRKEFLGWLSHFVVDAVKGILKFVNERDISVSVVEGKFELKRSGG
jgi:hypothetical protein